MKSLYQRKIIASGLFAGLLGSLIATAARAADTIFETNAGGVGGVNTIGKYTTSGATVNPALISGLSDPTGIALSGADLFVTNRVTGTIGEYTTSGATVNAALISGLSTPFGIVVSGSDLFVTNLGSGTVGEYTTSGVTVNRALMSGLKGPRGIAVSGSDLFVANIFDRTIGEYTTSGATVNAAMISGLGSPWGIAYAGGDPTAVLGSGVPEASTWAMSLTGFAALAFAGFRRARSRRSGAG
jgi:hypothetical protein